jgi:hypothetical protein
VALILLLPILRLVAFAEILTLVADVPMFGRAARFDY